MCQPDGIYADSGNGPKKISGRQKRLTLSGRNSEPIGYRAVYVDDVHIGVVFRKFGQTWSAEDMAGRLHGDQYTSDWNAARQLALAINEATYDWEGQPEL